MKQLSVFFLKGCLLEALSCLILLEVILQRLRLPLGILERRCERGFSVRLNAKTTGGTT